MGVGSEGPGFWDILGKRQGRTPAPSKAIRRPSLRVGPGLGRQAVDGGKDGQEGAGQPSGPAVGRSWQLLLGAGVLSACQVSAAAWEEPSPEILIQGRNRTGFSTGSAKGDRGRKKPGGQEGSGRTGGEAARPDGVGAPDGNSSPDQPPLLGPRRQFVCILLAHGCFAFCIA